MNQLLSDMDCLWNSDLSPSNSGDILPVAGSERGKQRILRRLLTNPGSYIFHPDYGAGVRRFIGQYLSSAKFNEIKGLIRSQIMQEAVVARTPAPIIMIQQTQDLSLFCNISYFDAIEKIPVVLSFTASQ